MTYSNGIQPLLSCFTEFLTRGSSTERRQLIQLLEHPISASRSLSTQDPTDHISPPCFLPFEAPTNFEDVFLSYTREELGTTDKKRQGVLLEAAWYYLKKPIIPHSSHNGRWLTKAGTDEETEEGPTSPIHRIYQGCMRTEHRFKDHERVRRFALLCFSHYVDETVASRKKSRLGRTELSTVLQQIHEDLIVSAGAVAEVRRSSLRYVTILVKSGPADLLELDGNSKL